LALLEEGIHGFKKRHQAAMPKWEGKHMLHAFCNKCVHISSKPNFQEAYLSEYLTEFNDL